MMISKRRTGAVALLLAVGLLASPLLPGLNGTSKAEDRGTWQDLVFLYTTDIKGKIEPCG